MPDDKNTFSIPPIAKRAGGLLVVAAATFLAYLATPHVKGTGL